MRFLEEIYRGDIVWGQLPAIKTYILDILKQLSLVDDDLQGMDHGTCSMHIY